MLGVDLELPQLDVILADLRGLPVATKRTKLTGDLSDPLATLSQLADLLRAWTEETGHRWDQVVGVGVGALFVADAYALHVTMTRFGVELPFRKALVVRGTSYSLAAVNYNLGQGSLVYLVSRASGRDLVTCTGAVMGAMGTQVLVLLCVVLLGVAADTSGALAPLRGYALVGGVAMLAGFALLFRPPSFLKSWRLTKPVVQAGPSGLLVAMAARLPHTAVLFGLNWAVMALFGIHPPLGEGLVRLSAIFFVIALPISVQGLGTGQAAAAMLLAPYAQSGRAAVVAYSLSVWALAVAFQLVIGFPFLFFCGAGKDASKGSPRIQGS